MTVFKRAISSVAAVLLLAAASGSLTPQAKAYGSYDHRPTFSDYNQQSGACSIGYGCK